MPTDNPNISRRRLLDIEKQNAVRIIAEFEKIKRRLLSNAETLSKTIEAARAAGAGNLQTLIAEQNRVADLFSQVTREIERKTPALSFLTANAQTGAIQTAKMQAAADFAGKAEIISNLNFFDGGAVSEIVGLSGNKKKLDFLFSNIAPAVRNEMFSALSFGIANGSSNYQIARELKNKFNFAPVRALTIARTETNRAYREASRTFYAETPGVIGWVWLSALDLRTCVICWGQHGRIFRTNKRFNSHPNCRCTMKAVFADTPPETSGIVKFATLTDAGQKSILGSRRFDLYKDGLPFASFVGAKQTPFGKSPILINLNKIKME